MMTMTRGETPNFLEAKAPKRSREVFLYSDEEVDDTELPGPQALPTQPREAFEELEPLQDVREGEWAEDLRLRSPPSVLPPESKLRFKRVEADNGFHETALQFEASLKELRQRHPAYRAWLQREQFLHKTIGRRLYASDEDAEDRETPDDMADDGAMQPVVDDDGHVHAVVTRGGYQLTVDEREFVGEPAAAVPLSLPGVNSVDDIRAILPEMLSEDACAALWGVEAAPKPFTVSDEEEDEEEDDEAVEEAMDALVTVAVTKQLIDCFADEEGFAELEPELQAASVPFLAMVRPLFAQREKLQQLHSEAVSDVDVRKRTLRQDSCSEIALPEGGAEGSVDDTTERGDEVSSGASSLPPAQASFIRDKLALWLPQSLDDDKVFAEAVDAPLRRVLRAFRMAHRPPKDEKIVIDGVEMDF